MAQQLHAGQIVPESGLYRVWHEPAHLGASNEVTFIRGRRFPTCPDCSTVSFELLQSDETYRHYPSSAPNHSFGTLLRAEPFGGQANGAAREPGTHLNEWDH
jgi:hypothetical protein